MAVTFDLYQVKNTPVGMVALKIYPKLYFFMQWYERKLNYKKAKRNNILNSWTEYLFRADSVLPSFMAAYFYYEIKQHLH